MKVEETIRDRLSRTDVQAKVEQLWRWLYPGKALPREFPVSRMGSDLEKRNVVRIEPGRELPMWNGKQCYGEFTVHPRKRILLHRTLERGSPRFVATLAHEIGHLVLHRKYLGVGTYLSTRRPPANDETRERFGSYARFSDLDWVEWQANEFMLCLLLPREALILRLVQKEAEMGFPIGPIFIDQQPWNQVAAGQVIAGIASDVMIQMPLVEGRMHRMGLIRDTRSKERVAFGGQSVKGILARQSARGI